MTVRLLFLMRQELDCMDARSRLFDTCQQDVHYVLDLSANGGFKEQVRIVLYSHMYPLARFCEREGLVKLAGLPFGLEREGFKAIESCGVVSFRPRIHELNYTSKSGEWSILFSGSSRAISSSKG